MNEDSIQTQYDLTKKTKIRKIYEEYKNLIYSALLILIITVISINFYLSSKEKKKILLTDNYISAKIYLANGKNNEAKNILKQIVYDDDSTYSTLSLFLILDEDLITDNEEMSNLFAHVLKNNKFEKEVENSIIYKKLLFQANFVSEQELLESIKPLINKNSIWKPHALLLAGDYFFFKEEYLKAKEFYIQILDLKNIQNELHKQARSQLAFIPND